LKVIETNLSGCLILEPNLFHDERGYFFESFNRRFFNEAIGEEVDFIQDNQSFSKRGALRGLHFQKGEFSQAKLVRVIQGEVLDIVVDIRQGSPTFGRNFSIVLSEENKKQLFIPRGFAHGFAVLSKEAQFFYKCDNYYNKASEGGIAYNDPVLNIDWNLDKEDIIVSEKDLELPSFSDCQF
jgi:dTDP-4-dehydrorhamnose 3,5-epimerase|tara:strand:- start:2336 stop:2881 length:546 start_codon:yes stop_codon:yes gene_type:complete